MLHLNAGRQGQNRPGKKALLNTKSRTWRRDKWNFVREIEKSMISIDKLSDGICWKPYTKVSFDSNIILTLVRYEDTFLTQATSTRLKLHTGQKPPRLFATRCTKKALKRTVTLRAEKHVPIPSLISWLVGRICLNFCSWPSLISCWLKIRYANTRAGHYAQE